MTPKIIFKQRHRDGGSKRSFSAMNNSGHLKYIGERQGVVKTNSDENAEHLRYIGKRSGAAECPDTNNGLFGCINGEFQPNCMMSEAQAHIRQMSVPSRDIFRCVFSFSPETAEEAGLYALKNWQDFVKSNMVIIAKHMNMKIENVEWYAAVHLKEGQPHVHVMYWDKSQQIAVNRVDPKICDSIRIDVTKSTFRDFYNELHNKEDRLISQMRTAAAWETKRLLTSRSDSGYYAAVSSMLDSIYCKLPSKGQMLYGYMPQDVKDELNRLTHFLIDNNEECAKMFQELLQTRRLYNETLHSAESNWGKLNLAAYEGKLCDDIERRMGNTILKLLAREKKSGRENLFAELDRGASEAEKRAFESERDKQTESAENNADSRKTDCYICWSKKFKAARSAAESGNYEKAFCMFQAEAANGNVLAMYEIADLYRRELIPDDCGMENSFFGKALDGFLRLEAENESMKSYLQYRIGRMYFDGYGAEQDFPKALEWLEKAALNGNHLAEYTAAKMYRDGIGTAANPLKSEQFMERAAHSGNVYARFALARMYLNSDVPQRNIDGKNLLESVLKSCDKDMRNLVEYTLGAAYYYNDNLHNSDKAKELLESSAAGGNEYAVLLLEKIAQNEETAAINLAQSVFSLLKERTESSRAELSEAASAVFGRGDLSKEAISELIYKRKDKQNTAER